MPPPRACSMSADAAGGRTPGEHDLEVRAAWLYHVERLTQAELARALRVSRARVVRLLAGAREQGVVQVGVDERAAQRVALSRALVRRFDLRHAIVVDGGARDDTIARAVGAAAGRYLAACLSDGLN